MRSDLSWPPGWCFEFKDSSSLLWFEYGDKSFLDNQSAKLPTRDSNISMAVARFNLLSVLTMAPYYMQVYSSWFELEAERSLASSQTLVGPLHHRQILLGIPCPLNDRIMTFNRSQGNKFQQRLSYFKLMCLLGRSTRALKRSSWQEDCGSVREEGAQTGNEMVLLGTCMVTEIFSID